jgi:hypothetical protein
MKKDLIETISGEQVERSICRKIRGIFYKLGDVAVENSGDCYKINDRYYKANTGYIIFDHRKNQYVVKKMNVIIENGVTGFNGKVPVFGAFSTSRNAPANVFLLYKGGRYICLNESIVENNPYYLEDLRTGDYVDRQTIDAHNFITPAKVDENIKRTLPYDSRGITDKAIALYDDLYVPKYDSNINKYGAAVNDLTFGLEFETVKGFIPSRITDRLGLIPLRDGSIDGLEYVTIPLSGKKGMQTIADTLKQLARRTEYDENCALHIHIGNMPRTESFMVALMRVLFLIQDDMFALFPIYKKYNFGVKRKHYTKPYSYQDTVFNFDKVITPAKVKENFGHLYSFLTMDYNSYKDVGSDIGNVHSHPSDPHGTAKWNIKSRYYWVNMVPLLFGNKQTIEFRLHTPTYNVDKVLHFLVLCTSIIKYVKDQEKSILEDPKSYSAIDLYTILVQTCGNVNDGMVPEHIYSYLRKRRDSVYGFNKVGNIKGNEDTIVTGSSSWWTSEKTVSSKTLLLTSNAELRGNQFFNERPEVVPNIWHREIGIAPFRGGVPDREEEPMNDEENQDDELVAVRRGVRRAAANLNFVQEFIAENRADLIEP